MSKLAPLLLILASLPLSFAHATGGAALPKVNVNLNDEVSLQRGARTFVNYCLSCHSANYMRYSRMSRDLHIPEKAVMENMMFASDKIGSTMDVAMRPADAEQWLGMSPPDLSTIARSRGPDWLYAYLTSFYLDPKRPTGVNNLVFKETAMPHVLWEYQGYQKLAAGSNPAHPESVHLEPGIPGKLDPQQYRQMISDLVGFLVYLAEPVQLQRQRIGMWVLGYLAIMIYLLYRVKKEFWKDLH